MKFVDRQETVLLPQRTARYGLKKNVPIEGNEAGKPRLLLNLASSLALNRVSRDYLTQIE